MIKKFAAFIVLAFTLCLSACTLPIEPENDPLDALNAMLHADYSSVKLVVTNTFGENLSLTSRYDMTFTEDGASIAYEVERFATIDLAEAPGSAVERITGTAAMKDGAITGGEEIGLSAAMAERGFVFRSEYFENIILTDIYFIADVKDAAGFMGTELDCTDMKVTATFFRSFNDLDITYSSGKGTRVTIEYTFGI